MTGKADMSCEFPPFTCQASHANGLASTKLDAEKRLALQEEKQALETKLLEVYVVENSFAETLVDIRLQAEDESEVSGVDGAGRGGRYLRRGYRRGRCGVDTRVL